MTPDEALPHPLIPFHTKEASLAVVGGKGANLVQLVHAGFPVPNGFLIPTAAYRDFVKQNGLGPRIQEALTGLDMASPDALEMASHAIRAQFAQGQIPQPLARALETGLQRLGERAVAVRSSATAEDLPDLSFAGQQDTFLNVVGVEALLEAVVGCWSSLWTARAIGYRARNQIHHEDVSLSVIVQAMVQSEASGVLFSANPLTGLRSETVIDATLGLGEALVGGHVEPDHYVVDTAAAAITHKSLGRKAVVMRGKPGGGVASQEADSSQTQALPDEAILRLAMTGKQIEALYGFPQDIEWAWASGQIHILQSRPISSLYPLPEGMKADPLQIMFSFGAVQGLLDPITPLGQDAIRFIIAGGTSFFGFDLDHETQGILRIAGGRLWANLTGLVRHPLGVKVIPRVFPGIEPGSLPTLMQILEEPEAQAGQGRWRLQSVWRVGRFLIRILRPLLAFVRRPEEAAKTIPQRYQARILALREASQAKTGDPPSLAKSAALFRREIYGAFPFAVPEIAIGAAAGLLPLGLLTRLSHEVTGSGELALAITRGLPNNVTTAMDLNLWQAARTIQSDAGTLNHMRSHSVKDLVEQYRENRLPDTAQRAIAHFMAQYGMRGPGELDIGRPRWREHPAPLMQSLHSYLQIEDATMAPDVVFARGEQAAREAAAKLESAARRTRGGALKARVIRAAVRRVRALAGLRESPKFYIIQVMDILRQGLLDRGQELVESGRLAQADDLFFLYFNELEAFARGQEQDWGTLIAQRRADYGREQRRRQIPRLLLSDGRAFYEGMIASDDEEGFLRGSPVSPGMVEGSVRVVLDPQHANLAPGEILVCPGTDPAWTPLFLAAGGLVMEVGGMMTHGAIVAREYGIPAVVGVDRATERLQTGDRIRVDGNTGRIEKV